MSTDSRPDSSLGFPPEGFLEAFGYTPDFARALQDLLSETPGQDLDPARVVFQPSEHYRLITASGEVQARPAGRLRLGSELPVVGDWVAAPPRSRPDVRDGVVPIAAILPRRTSLSRKVPGKRTVEQVVAANVDTVFVVMGLDGDYNLRRLERFTVMIWESGAQPVAVLTKADLHEDPAGARLDALAAVPGVPVLAVSSLENQGMDALRAHLEPRRTCALVGSSGAGKSTLLNRLYGDEVMRTGAVREGDDRGRHTTTHRQLVRLPDGALLIDNPGVREIQLWAGEESLGETFSDVEDLSRACRFRDCHHEDEPGCAVQAAVEDGRLEEARLESWRSLQKELRHLERRRDVAESRRQDKRLGQLYKRIQAEKKGRRRGH